MEEHAEGQCERREGREGGGRTVDRGVRARREPLLKCTDCKERNKADEETAQRGHVATAFVRDKLVCTHVLWQKSAPMRVCTHVLWQTSAPGCVCTHAFSQTSAPGRVCTHMLWQTSAPKR
eukprot:2517357-Pleurochrysis_carterae.AAC.3